MTAVRIQTPQEAIPSRGKSTQMTDQTASGTTGINIEIQPDGPCLLDIAINKPAGAVCTVVLVKGGTGAQDPQIDSAAATSETQIGVSGISMARGDELHVDIDTTSGAKTVSASARGL